MKKLRKQSIETLEQIAMKSTSLIGSVNSIIVHTIVFVISFALYFFGVNMDKILLVVTTLVSLEAIYLAIFIQMTVTRNLSHLTEVAQDIDEIQEDIDEIQEDVDEIQEDIEEDEEEEEEEAEMLIKIQDTLGKLAQEIIELKKQHTDSQNKKK